MLELFLRIIIGSSANRVVNAHQFLAVRGTLLFHLHSWIISVIPSINWSRVDFPPSDREVQQQTSIATPSIRIVITAAGPLGILKLDASCHSPGDKRRGAIMSFVFSALREIQSFLFARVPVSMTTIFRYSERSGSKHAA